MRHLLLVFGAMAFSCAAAFGAKPNGLVILCTDYGADSIYVGVIKGAIYSKSPSVRVDSITNSIPNYDIAAGAYLLAEGAQQYPKGTTFVAVVDPGVGTARRPIAIETNAGQFFVAPDNGLLTLVAQRDGVRRAHVLTNKALWREGTESSTFHGRDIFGPVGASIAGGAAISKCGPEAGDLVSLDLPCPALAEGAIHGEVVRTDDYGNAVTNIPGSMLDRLGIALHDNVAVTVGDAQYIAPRAGTYGEVPPGERLVCVQSIGMAELAINKGDLVKAAHVALHAKVTLRKAAK
jgi:S-adenosylmethionine hydrolase